MNASIINETMNSIISQKWSRDSASEKDQIQKLNVVLGELNYVVIPC